MRKPVLERKILDGNQKIYRFENDYGASIIRHSGSFGGNLGLWELAVIAFWGDGIQDWDIVYDTSITDDVIGHLNQSRVDDILGKISNLPKRIKIL